MMNETNGKDIQEYNYMMTKAKENDIDVKISGNCFVLTKMSTGGILGTMYTVNEVFNYLCGYEAGIGDTIINDMIKWDFSSIH